MDQTLSSNPLLSISKTSFKSIMLTSVAVEFSRVLLDEVNFLSSASPQDSSQALLLSSCPMVSIAKCSFIGQKSLGAVLLRTDETKLTSIQITNSSFEDLTTDSFGSALRIEGFSLIRIEMGVFKNCKAKQNGGAIYFSSKNSDSRIGLINCSFLNNSAEGTLLTAEVL
jgi:hypothetical protein